MMTLEHCSPLEQQVIRLLWCQPNHRASQLSILDRSAHDSYSMTKAIWNLEQAGVICLIQTENEPILMQLSPAIARQLKQ